MQIERVGVLLMLEKRNSFIIKKVSSILNLDKPQFSHEKNP